MLLGTEHQLGLYMNHPLGDPGSTTINVLNIWRWIFSSMAETCEIIGSSYIAPLLVKIKPWKNLGIQLKEL